jgi:uncharacterized protein YggE
MVCENFTDRARGVLFVVLSVAALGYVYQFGKEVNQGTSSRTFSADAESTVNVTPDVAQFSVSLITEGGKNVGDIQKQNIDKMNTVNAYLKEMGIEKKDLQTTQYGLSPRYSYPNCVRDGQSVCPPPSISGYTLNQSLSVKVRDLEKLGDILSGVVDKGANSVSGVNFVVDDPAVARNQARVEAIAKAKQSALDIAKAGGFRIGKMTSIYEDPGYPATPMYNYGEGMGGAAKSMDVASTPTIEPGTSETKVHVTITYEIRD